MDDASAIRRLKNHANLGEQYEPPEQSVVLRLWLADKGEAELEGLEELFGNVIECLQTINRSENRGQLIRDVAYAVSGIVTAGIQYDVRWRRSGRVSQEMCLNLGRCTFLVAFAWDQLLAGDIEDLTEGAEAGLY